ncbi:alcohol dehydrogenase catalytic domain-containing protein [Actinomadura luteofluorescens]|uniref:alcohol dehydrogenase catalytic domain-containing protein n=1 Tax=Actinomadura luteofluorescens TaxID=46163 RepID=UPI003D8CF89F
MRALSATGDDGLVRVPEPSVAAGEVLVDVQAVSVNRGELHRLTSATAGWRPGWDFAGVVADQEKSGTAPAAGHLLPGTRVFGIADGGSWAERVAVPAARLAVIPDGLTLEWAATLPTAGLTALRTLRMAGDLAGASVGAAEVVVGVEGVEAVNDLDGPRTADDLTYLARLVTTGELAVDIAAVNDWRDARETLHRLRDRRVAGRAVLLVAGEKPG